MYAALLCVAVFLAAADQPPDAGLVPFRQDGKWGFKDAEGSVVIEPTYDEVRNFAFGLAPVNRGAVRTRSPIKMGGKWGYIDVHDKLVVPIALDYANEFSDGLALVSDARGERYLDTAGKVAIDLGTVSSAGDFHEGLAPVREDRSLAGKDWRTRFIDKQGRTVFSVDGYAAEFHDGLAVVSVARKDLDPKINNRGKLDGYVDRQGKMVIPPQFAEALAFHEGLAAVRTKKTTIYGKGDTWGYIDRSGKYVLDPDYNEAHAFHDGSAWVHVGGTLHVVCDAPFYWRGGRWLRIDREGTVLEQREDGRDQPETPVPTGRS